MLSMQLSITFLREFDNETLNDELTDVLLFHGQKIYVQLYLNFGNSQKDLFYESLT